MIIYNSEKTDIDSAPQLFQYQIDGIEKINKNFKENINSLLNYSVGSGKTRVACEIIKEHIGHSYILVICPSTEIINSAWLQELTPLGIKTKVLTSKVLKKLKDPSDIKFINSPNFDVYIMTYNLLITKDSSTNEKYSLFFDKNPPSLIVFDEFHNVSNNFLNKKKGINHNKILSNTVLSMLSKHKLGLTGTPIVNSKIELEAAFLLLNYNKLGTPFYNSNFLISYSKNKLISTDYLIFYRPIHKEIDHIIAKQNESEYLFARQTKATRATLISTTKETTKEKLIENIIESINKDEKIIIFEGQIDCLYVMEQYKCIKNNFPTVIHGYGMSKEERDKKLNTFRNSNSRILLTTKKLSSEGLNLQIANNLIICGLSWTYKEIEQCIGRINRKGQTKIPHTFIISEIESNEFSDEELKTFSDFISEYKEIENPSKYFPEYVNNYLSALTKKSSIFEYNNQVPFNPNILFINEKNINRLTSIIDENNEECSKLILHRKNEKLEILNLLEILENKDYLKLFKFMTSPNIDNMENKLISINENIQEIKPKEVYKKDDDLEKVLKYSYDTLTNLHLYLHYMNINFFYKDLIKIKYEESEIQSNYIETLSELIDKIRDYKNTLECYDYIYSEYISIHDKYLTLSNTICNLNDLINFPTKEELLNFIESNKEKANNLLRKSFFSSQSLDIEDSSHVIVNTSDNTIPFDDLLSYIQENISKLTY